MSRPARHAAEEERRRGLGTRSGPEVLTVNPALPDPVLKRLTGAPAPMHMMLAEPCAWLLVAELTAPDVVAAGSNAWSVKQYDVPRVQPL